uniref:PDZ domain-containing protein n=1 Tax=Mesocestoides corti TaxID=53468 RepID=A0A5K3F4P5_MESCO
MNTYLGCVTTSDSRGSQFGRQKVQAVSSNHGPNLAATIDRIANASASRTHGYANNQESVQTVVLTRTQLDKPWGFRIQGGQDYNLQLTVKKTQPGSPAEGQLHSGDEIFEINGQDTRTLSHSQATESIRASGKDLKLTINKPVESEFSNLRVQNRQNYISGQ